MAKKPNPFAKKGGGAKMSMPGQKKPMGSKKGCK